MKLFKKITSFISFFIFLSLTLWGFEGNAQDVKVTLELELNALPEEKREKLVDFKQVLEEYCNNFTWTKGEFVGELPINLNILMQDISVSHEDRYKLQIIISNTSDVQYTDKRCRMEYQKGEVPVHSENNWDSLTSLLDFFINIVIGEEMDKFDQFLGTSYFERAKLIAEQARFGMAQFNEGWDLRVEMINEILSDNTLKYREMKNFYFYGLYFAQEDPVKARIYCNEAIDMIEEILPNDNPKYNRCKNFLKAHHIEIVELFKGSGDSVIYEKMIRLDPEREQIYRQFL